MQLLKKIRSYDIYGKQIDLNFNSKGNSHNTYIGGVCSVFSTLFYIMYCGQKIINASDNANIDWDSTKINPMSLGEMSLGEADYIPRY